MQSVSVRFAFIVRLIDAIIIRCLDTLGARRCRIHVAIVRDVSDFETKRTKIHTGALVNLDGHGASISNKMDLALF